jgi:hypothetical protein
MRCRRTVQLFWKDAPFFSWEQRAFSELPPGFCPRFLTCLGLVDPPGEEAPLGDRLFCLVVRLAVKESAATEERWEPLVESCRRRPASVTVPSKRQLIFNHLHADRRNTAVSQRSGCIFGSKVLRKTVALLKPSRMSPWKNGRWFRAMSRNGMKVGQCPFRVKRNPMDYQAFECMLVGNRVEWTTLFLSEVMHWACH